MGQQADQLADDLSNLTRLRDEHGLHLSTLPADVALVGLALDVDDSAGAALDLLSTPRPYRALGPARTAFEAAQRVIVLATAEHYATLGARAWVYYKRKECALYDGPGAVKDAQGLLPGEAFLKTSIAQMAEIWGSHEPRAATILNDENAWLAKSKGADNFLGRSLAGPAADGWKRARDLFGTKNATRSEDMESVNRAVYMALSHDAHARIRLDPQGLRVDSDGYVEIIPVERDMAAVRHTVLTTIHSSTHEAAVGLAYRIRLRADARGKSIAAALPGMSRVRRRDYYPDFGTMIASRGNPAAEMYFPDLTLGWLRSMPDGTLLTGGVFTFDQRYCANFDFKGAARSELLRRLPPDIAKRFVRSDAPPPTSPSIEQKGMKVVEQAPMSGETVVLDPPVQVNLVARLGKPTKNEGEDFIPLVVTRVW